MGEQVKLLEHHAHFAGNAAHIIFVDIFCAGSGFSAQRLAINDNTALIDGLKLIQAAQQRAFATAGGADDGNYFALVDLQIDALQDL